MTLQVVATSAEYLWVPVRSSHPATGDQVINTYPVAVALITSGDPQTTDWQTATWDGTKVLSDNNTYYLARVQVGPGGAVTLTAGTTYIAYAKLTVGALTPVVQAGTVRAI